MATHRLPLLGFGTLPDSSGECFFQSAAVLFTTDFTSGMVARFGSSNVAAPTASIQLYGGFDVPKNYVGTASVVYVWTASLTSGVVRWRFVYNTFAGDDTTSMDPGTWQEDVSWDDTAPGAAFRRLETSQSLTSANFAADDVVSFRIIREATHANDTMAGAAALFGAFLQYSDA